MYTLTKKLSRVLGIKLFNNKIYYTVDGVLKVNGDSIIQGVEGSSFWFIDDWIYFFTEEGERVFNKDDENHLIEVPLFIGTESEGNIFCRCSFRKENRKWKWILGVFDLETLSLIKQLPIEDYTVVFVHASIGIGYYEKNNLSALNITNGDIKWEVDLELLDSKGLNKVLGLYKNQFLVACSDHLLLSIDIESGEIIHQWLEFKGFEAGSFYRDVLPDPTNFVLDKDAAKLIGVFDTYYFEIDLDSREISYHQLKDELSRYGISDFRPFNNNPFTSEHLFLTAHTYLEEFPNIDLSSVLALNRQTKKVDWVHIFKDTGLGTNVPQITSTHLYQLDTEKNLFIFERDRH